MPKTASQMERVDGAPFGTRGGISVDAHVPGRRRLRLPHGRCTASRSACCSAAPCHGRADRGLDRRRARRAARDRPAHERADTTGLTLQDAADSRHGRAAARVGRVHPALRGPGRRPDRADRAHAGRHPDRQSASASPRCRTSRDLSIVGPHEVTGVSDTPSRRKIFTCRPTAPAEEAAVRARDRQAAGDAGVPRPGRRRRLRRR